MDRTTLYELFNFDIDRYLNPFIPRSRLHHIPRPISHFLGYRKSPQKDPPSAVSWLTAVVATIGGLCLIGGLFNTAPGIKEYHAPVLIASLGATAVLEYNAMRSPLSQPRNAILGQTLSAIVGVGISKLFQHSPTFFNKYEWVSAAVGCACASLVMSMTNTIHPPGGATAVLASTEAAVIAMGWIFVPLVLLATCLMIAVACVVNNVFRQYPVYWWTAEEEIGSRLPTSGSHENKKQSGEQEVDADKVERQSSLTSSERTLQQELSNRVEFVDGLKEMYIRPYTIEVPAHINLSDEEVTVLKHLQERMRMQGEVGG